MKKKFKKNKAFALFITINLLILFSFLSISIIETQTITSNINKLKYLHLQAYIHMQNIKSYIKNNSDNKINTFKLNDDRFKINITKQIDNDQSFYSLSIETIDDSRIRITQKVVK